MGRKMPKTESLVIGQVQENLDHAGRASFIYCHRKAIEITVANKRRSTRTMFMN
jgi:hypothetical protein